MHVVLACCIIFAFNYLKYAVSSQKDLSTDLDGLMTQLQEAEKELQQFNTKQIKERLPLIDVN